MAKEFSEFTGQFFWNFKRMDNVNYNFEIIKKLYAAKKVKNNDPRFNKPLIILIMAIIECTLYDFIERIHQYSNDSFPNITDVIVSYFRGTKETDELKIIIQRIKSQNLLRVSSSDSIYEDLEHLRLLRNRVHIQNRYAIEPADEHKAFTSSELDLAQRCLEKVFDALCNVYPRWDHQPIPMNEFPRPWL